MYLYIIMFINIQLYNHEIKAALIKTNKSIKQTDLTLRIKRYKDDKYDKRY
jgi:hypothetical protein